MERSEGERRAAVRPADQPEAEGKRPNVRPASQRDNIEARKSAKQKSDQERGELQ